MALINFFDTPFFSALRESALYEQTLRGSTETIILIPYDSAQHTRATSAENSRASEIISSVFKTAIEIDDTERLKTVECMEIHILKPTKLPDRYLNLLGQAVDFKDGKVYGSFGFRYKKSAKILTEESMYDHDCTFKVVVLEGSLLEDDAATVADDSERTEDRNEEDAKKAKKKFSLYDLVRSQNPDYLLIYPHIEKEVFNSLQNWQNSFLALPGWEKSASETIDGFTKNAAAKIHANLEMWRQKKLYPNGFYPNYPIYNYGRRTKFPVDPVDEYVAKLDRFTFPDGTDVSGDGTDAIGDGIEGAREIDVIMNPELSIDVEKEGKDVDEIYTSISHIIYSSLTPFLWSELVKSSATDQEKVNMGIQNFDSLEALMAQQLGDPNLKSPLSRKKENHDAGKMNKKTAKSILSKMQVVESICEVGAGILSRLDNMTNPHDKFMEISSLVTFIPKAVAECAELHGLANMSKNLEADDLISLCIAIVWHTGKTKTTNTKIEHIIAHLRHAEMMLQTTRNLASEVEYSFSVLQSAVMFFVGHEQHG